MTVKPTLDGVYAKIVRAHQKFDEFHTVLRRFVSSHPYYVTVQQDSQADVYRLIVGFRPAPPELAVLAGEFAHNLRGALDHLAWQLVIDNQLVPNTQTNFPLWVAPRVDSRTKYKLMPSILPGVFPDVEAFVYSVQPYVTIPHDPSKAALAILARLNNVDKHHQLSTVFGGVLETWFRVQSRSTGALLASGLVSGVVEDGTNIATVSVPGGNPRDMDVELGGTPAVAIDVEGEPISLANDERDGLRQVLGITVEAVILPLIPKFRNL